MSLKKIICPQCGSNELQLFGRTAFKCDSCGTILKEEPEPKKEEIRTETPVKAASAKPFRSKRIMRGFGEENPETVGECEDHHEVGNQFMKTIFWIGMLSVIASVLIWMFGN